MKLSRFLFVCIVFFFLPSIVTANPGKKKIIMVIGAGDSVVIARAFKELQKLPLISKHYVLEFYTDREVRNNTVKGDHIQDADIIMADFMHRDIDGFLSENLPGDQKDGKPKIYSLRVAHLANKLKKNGFKLNIQTEKYYSPPTVDNIKNIIFLVLSEEGETVSYGPPFTLPRSGIFHPDSPEVFADFEAYLKWYRKSGKYSEKGFWVGIHTFGVSALNSRSKIEGHIIDTLEKEGINALPVFGRPPYYKSMQKFFLDGDGQPRVQILIGFSASKRNRFNFLRKNIRSFNNCLISKWS